MASGSKKVFNLSIKDLFGTFTSTRLKLKPIQHVPKTYCHKVIKTFLN